MALVEDTALMYQQLIEAAGYALVTVDRSGIIRRMNPQLEALTEYREKELLGRPYNDFFKPLQTFTELTTRTGKTRWVEQISVKTPDGSDEIMLRDITERKNTEQRLRLLESAVEQTNNAIIITESDLNQPGPRIVFVNPASANMTGYRQDELIGQTPRLLQGDETERAVLDELRGHLDRGETFSAETVNYRKDGTPYLVQWSIAPVYDDGGLLTHYVSVQRDVTEQRRTENALRQTQTYLKNVLSSVPVALFTWDHHGMFVFSEGREARPITGHNGDIVGHLAHEVFDVEIVEKIEAALTGQYSETRLTIDDEIYAFYITPSHDDHGQITGAVGIAMNITQRERSEAELRRREELYRTLARTLPQTAVFLFDNDLRYMITEGAILERQGFRREAMEGQTLYEVLPQPMAQGLEPLYRAALAGQETTVEIDFGSITYNIVALPVRNNDGEIFAGMVVAQDISSYKKTEKALRGSEQRIRALLQAIPDTMFVLNTQGVYVEFDSGKTTHNFLAPARIVGMNIRHAGVPEPLVRQVFDHMENAIKTAQTQTFTYELNVAHSLWSYEARFVALNENEVLVIVRNITDLKQMQAELQKRVNQLMILSQVETELADQLNVEYVLTMALDSAVRLSEASAGFIGLVENDQLRLVRLIGDYSEERLVSAFDSQQGIASRAVRHQRAEFVRDVTADPDYVALAPHTLMQIAIPLISRDTLIGVLNLETNRSGVFTEQTMEFVKLITARIAVAIDNSRLYRQTATQLRELQSLYDRVRKLEQLKTDMIRIASHDLRNPLMTIMGYLGIIRESLPDKSEVEGLDYIERAARTMRRITTDILSLERIEEAAQNGNFTLFDFKALVEEVYHDQQPSAKLKAQELLLNIGSARFMFEGDPVQLKEAAANFVSNAIKYTPDKGRVSVRLFKRDDRMVFEVEDNGYGIKEEQQARLFQPFFRSRSVETKDIEGTGLGLHLVKNIIERHGGIVFFKSVYGKGSTFGFELPLETGVVGEIQ